MKDCDIIQPELSAYVDGELTRHGRELVEAHLASCPHCREALAQLKALATGMAALPKLEAPPRFLAEVRHKIMRGDDPEAPTWHDYLFRPFWIKVPLELAALFAVALLVMQYRQQPRDEPLASDQMAQAENPGNEQSSPAQTDAMAEHPAEAESARTAQPPSPSAAPESEAASAPAGEAMPSQEAAATSENGAESSANVASEPAAGSYRALSPQAESAVAGSADGIKPAVESRRKVAAVTRGTVGFGTTPTPSTAEVATLARSVGIEPSKISGVVVVHSADLNEAKSRAELLADRCNGKVISVSPSMGSTAQVFFVEVPREFAASFKLDIQQDTASATLSTNAMADRVAVVTTNGSPLSATSTARVVGVLTGGVETNALFNGAAQLTLANNPRAQAATMTVLEILVVPPPSLAPANPTPIPVTPAR